MDKIKTEDINDLTHKIIGCAMQVHSVLGNGFQEVIYQRALAIEMRYADSTTKCKFFSKFIKKYFALRKEK